MLKILNFVKQSTKGFLLCLIQVPDFCKDKTEREYKRESRTVRRTRDWTAHDMITVYCAKAYDPEFKFH